MRFLRVWVRALYDGARDPNAQPLYVAVGGLLLTGTVFYSLVEGWSVIDALYFCVTTLATVGFGDFAPQTDVGKIFTIVYILAGISVILAFANMVLERVERAPRMRSGSGEAPPESRT
jgi:voltage-gated potassium channel